MRACGIGAFRFVAIVSILSFAALGLGLFNALYFAPHAAANLLSWKTSSKPRRPPSKSSPASSTKTSRTTSSAFRTSAPPPAPPLAPHLPRRPHPARKSQHHHRRPGPGLQPRPRQTQALRLHLLDGSQHQISPTDPNQYDISTFASTDPPIQFNSQDDTHISRSDTPLHALSLRELLQRIHAARSNPSPLNTADARAARIELNLRFSYPFACIVLMLIGVPLGLSSRRGGKSAGVVLTLLLVFAYYLLSNIGVAFAKSGKLSPALGVWAANLIFTAFGISSCNSSPGPGS